MIPGDVLFHKFKSNPTDLVAAKNHPEMPVQMRDLLRKVGDEPIVKIQLGRRPVKDLAIKLINFLSDSKFQDKQLELGYDEIYHNYLLITIQNSHGPNVLQQLLGSCEQNTHGTITLRLEKSCRIALKYPIIPDEFIDVYDIPLTPNKPLTLNRLISAASNTDEDFFKYDAAENNMCQTFVANIIESNGLITNIVDEATLKALNPINSKELLSTLGSRAPVIKTTTDLGAKLDKLISDHRIKLKTSKSKEYTFGSTVHNSNAQFADALYNALLQLEQNESNDQ